MKLIPKKRDIAQTLLDDALNQYYKRESAQLEDWLSLKYGGPIQSFLPSVLLQPVRDLMSRPGKRVRGRLVELGYELALSDQAGAKPDKELCRSLSDAIEYLHAGSLAVDDLQDGSKMRRGQPTLHLKYGLPVALNTGNWLYFWPLETIQRLNLPADRELAMYRFYHRTLIRAHVGQALDVGLPVNRIPQEKVPGLCLTAIELKSGALFALALVLGALAGGANASLVQALDEFGHGFGMALQMFDDLGNIKGRVEPTKRWEDLILRRPTWIWACAASHYSKATYDRFVSAVLQLPQDRRLTRWFEQQRFLQVSYQDVLLHLEQCHSRLDQSLQNKASYQPILKRLRDLGREISKAYG